MTRYPPGHKEETRQKILDAAGRLFRRQGYAASGVAQVMEDAGLTVGGFYAHFASKETLLSEILARSIEATRGLLMSGLEEVRGTAFITEVARRYLSRTHRDQAANGCALPSLAAEVGRQSEETRAAFESYFLELIAPFEERMPGPPKEGALSQRDRAIALASLFVGGLMFARAVKSKELSDRILLACRRFAAVEDPK